MKDLSELGIHYLTGEIDEASCKEAVEFILKHSQNQTSVTELSLIINSPGGYLDPALGLIEVIRLSPIPVTTVTIGSVCSAAVDIAIAGDMRVSTPNTTYMIHQYSGGLYGKHHDLVASTKSCHLMHEVRVKLYSDCSSLTKTQVKDKLLKESDVWLTSEEAKKFGLVDKIIRRFK